jgi:hypothetical protein
MLYGGSRSGKTAIATYAMSVRASKEKSRHAILRSKFNHVKTSVWMDTLPKILNLAFPNLKVKESKTDYFLKFPNDSELWIAGLDDGARVEKILGKEFSTIFFNEVSQMDYRSIQMALTRLAEKNNLKKKAYYDMNPPSKNHWSYAQFIQKLNPIDNTPLKNPDMFRSIIMNPYDNMENIDGGYLDLLDTLPSKDKARFKDGLFSDSDEGAAYYSFDREIHIQDINRVTGTTFILMDFNVNPMTALVAQVVNDELWILDEVFLEGNSDTYKICAHLKNMGLSGARVIPDSTGVNRKTSGKSDFLILKEHGFVIENVFNPLQRDRVTNVNRLFHNNKIKINPKCVKLINDLVKVVWKDGDLFEGNDKMLTHISDCLGYGCWRLFPMQDKKVNRTIQF